MKKLLSILTIVVLILFLCSQAWATNIYINPDWEGTESGTFAEPYNSWDDVVISAGNDYRQLCGTTYTGSVTTTAHGTSGDHIIIGAYYDDGGVTHEDDAPSYGATCGNAAAKPIIDSTGTAFSFSSGANYTEVDSLQLKGDSVGVYVNGNHNWIQYKPNLL